MPQPSGSAGAGAITTTSASSAGAWRNGRHTSGLAPEPWRKSTHGSRAPSSAAWRAETER